MNITNLRSQILDGSRLGLSKAISLIESQRDTDRLLSQQLLNSLVGEIPTKSIRIAFSGSPGVGKSSFIDKYGSLLAKQGHKVAVLAVDPSSGLSGGSILGDKTRMNSLSSIDSAYIRPSPTGGKLGGLNPQTLESILLLEAAGYDRIIIETVGVGQNESDASLVADLFVLLQMPNSGDDLQGIKRGIMEAADVLVFNKADLYNQAELNVNIAALKNALHLLHNSNSKEVPVISCSSVSKNGIENFAAITNELIKNISKDGQLETLRTLKNKKWAIKSFLGKFQEYVLEGDSKFHKELNGLIDSELSNNKNPSILTQKLFNLLKSKIEA